MHVNINGKREITRCYVFSTCFDHFSGQHCIMLFVNNHGEARLADDKKQTIINLIESGFLASDI